MASGLTQSRKKILAIILAVIVLIVALVLIFIQFNNLRDLRLQVEEEQIALDESRAELIRRQKHRDNAPLYRERIALYTRMVPESPQEEEILRYFNDLSEEYNYRIVNINFGGRVTNEEQGYVRMPMTVNMEGRYQDLTGMLDHLRNSGRMVSVDNINISLTQETPANIRVVISASAFHSMNQ